MEPKMRVQLSRLMCKLEKYPEMARTIGVSASYNMISIDKGIVSCRGCTEKRGQYEENHNS